MAPGRLRAAIQHSESVTSDTLLQGKAAAHRAMVTILTNMNMAWSSALGTEDLWSGATLTFPRISLPS